MGDEKDILSSLVSELNRGTLVLGVLSQMKSPKYGYSLVQNLNEQGFETDPNTLYPLLRRLEKQGLLQSQWETDGPKPRKYYQRTLEGEALYLTLKERWISMAQGMYHLIEEDNK